MIDKETYEEAVAGILVDLEYIGEALSALKSPERTERDRYLAIAVTELEKLQAFVGYYLDK